MRYRRLGMVVTVGCLLGFMLALAVACFAEDPAKQTPGVVVKNTTMDLTLTVFAEGKAVGVTVPPGRKAFVSFPPGRTSVEVKVIGETREGDPAGMRTRKFYMPETWPIEAIDL